MSEIFPLCTISINVDTERPSVCHKNTCCVMEPPIQLIFAKQASRVLLQVGQSHKCQESLG